MKPLALGLLALLASSAPSVEAPRTRQGVKDELSGAKAQFRSLKGQIQQGRRKVQAATRQEASLVVQLSRLDRELDTVRREARTHERNLAIVEDRLGAIRTRMDAFRGEEAGHRALMGRRVTALYKAGPLRPALLLFSSRSTGELVSRWRFLRELARDDQRRIEEARRRLAQVEEYRREFKSREAELAKRRGDVAKARSQVDVERRRRESLLKKVRVRKSQAKEMLGALEVSAGELSSLMARLQAEAGRLSARPAPSTGGPTALRGRHSLPWPVKGRVLTRFGEQPHPLFRTKVFNRGVEIAASLGSEVKAVADGSVLYADYFEGFGQMVILDHGGGMLSVYGHNSALDVARGQEVAQGQRLAEVGDSGTSRQSALYFEIRHQAKPLDPLAYLQRR